MTDAEKTFCENWCKAHAKTWQVLNRSQWKYQFHPKTLVRYVDEVRQTEAEIQLILEFLSSSDCISTLSLYDQSVANTWKPTRAWLEVSNKSVQGVKAVRLYHGLMTDSTQAGDGPYVVENGCAYKVSFTYYWNQASGPSVPDSSSGVSYQVSGLSRDPETGLYTYAIEKHERVQQDVAEYLMATTVLEDTKEEYHLGVKQSDVATTGKAASVNNGKTVRRKISKNADCTSDIHNTTTEEKEVAGYSESVHVGLTGQTVTTTNRNMAAKASSSGLGIGESVENTETEGGRWNQVIRKVQNYFLHIGDSCRKTIFAHTQTKSDVQGSDPGFDHVSNASGGVIQEKSVSRTDNGGYRIEERTTTETPVSNASESVHAGLTGTTKTVTHRNQSDKASTDGLDVGESVENSKTEGGLWNQSIRTVVKNAYLKLSESCRKNLFAHAHETRHVQGSDPGFTHVSEAANGVVSEKSVSRTSDGSYEVSERTTTEKPVESAVESVSVTLSGTTRTVTNRNQANKAADPTNVGESVENRKTEGGLWDTTVRKLVKNAFLKIGETCSKTLFAHRHGTTAVQSSDPGFTHVSEAANGTVTEKRVNRTADGAYEVNETTTTEKPVSGVRKSWRKTLRGTVESITDRSQKSSLVGSGLKVGETRTSEETEGGLWNNTVEKSDGTPAGSVAEGCDRSDSEHTHTSVENVADKPTVEQSSPGVNRKVSVSAQRTEVDTWDKKTVETTYVPKKVSFTDGSSVVKTETTIGINQVDVPAGGADEQNVVRRASATPNDHGSYSTKEEVTTHKPTAASATAGASNATKQIKVSRNDTDGTVSDQPSTNKTVEASITPNDHGSYDKHVVVTTYTKSSATATVGAVKVKRTVKVSRNDTDGTVSDQPSTGKTVEASITPNDHGSYDKHVTVTKREEAVGEVSGKGSVKAQRTVRVVRNSDNSEVSDSPSTNKTVEASVTQNDDGTYDKHVTVTTYKEAIKSDTWSDNEYDYSVCHYKNQSKPIKPTNSSAGSSSMQFSCNDHGTYDGSWFQKSRRNPSGETLAWSDGPRQVTATIIYLHKGKWYKRDVSGSVYRCYGKVGHVTSHVSGGVDCSIANWKSGVWLRGINDAYGIKYTNVSLGDRTELATEDESSSGSQSD